MSKLSCKERDLILESEDGYPGWTVIAGLTDLRGTYGLPRVETTWEKNGRCIKDIRHPDEDYLSPDKRPCEHYELENYNE